MRARDHVLHQRRVAYRSGQRAAMIIGVEIAWRPVGIAAMGRLVTDHPATARRDADRPADIGAGGQHRRPRRQRCARPAGRSAGPVFRIEGVQRIAPQARIADARQGEFRRGGARMDDRPGPCKPLDHRVGMVVHMVLEDQRCLRGALALDALHILHRQRNALQRPCLPAHIAVLGRLRRRQRLVEIGVAEGVDLRLDGLGPRDNGLYEFNRRKLPRPEELKNPVGR